MMISNALFLFFFIISIQVLLGYEKGKIAANLHCENPRRDIAAIRDGKMEIVTEHKTFGQSYTAVNGISITGINAHVLLKGHLKTKVSFIFTLFCFNSSGDM